MTARRADIEHVLDLLGPDSDVTIGRFFGGWSLLLAGRQSGIVMDTVYLKVPKTGRAAWRAAGSQPFSYRTADRTVTVEAYWSVPAEAMDDGDLLRSLLRDPRPPREDHP